VAAFCAYRSDKQERKEMDRLPVIAGNWKMNMSPQEAAELASTICAGLKSNLLGEVIVSPTYLALNTVLQAAANSEVKVAAQNLHWEDKGAYTGEVSAPMLKAAGCTHVIIGHSERRQYFGETDETVNLKVKAALSHQLIPIVCVGESLEERERGETERRVEIQLRGGLTGLNNSHARQIIMAYEPIWAIGTGRTASPEQAQEVHHFIRGVLGVRFSKETASAIRIQYGGSVKSANVAVLMSQPDIDGALVGGASLSADSFISLVNNAFDLQ
jgi:triosephosphate isomerase